ncbi:MAG TPA: nucleotidyl transferase AbiEii/AbiGii toxin family protein [Candidatus Cybelea sp.]|nr:nucleotidyl transferase AbiEii/AbiGii toxin family protein [Candidatus Cybelea sp.]
MTFAPHLEILPPGQRAAWPHLKAAKDLGFVLYGGTAIALRLGHRQSVDFDFFSNRSLDRDALFRAISPLGRAVLSQDVADTLSVLVEPLGDETVKLSFFGNLSLARVGTPQETDDGVSCVASLEDLLGLKLAVLTQRVESRDYRDVAAILRGGAIRLAEGLGSARAIYGAQFAPAETLKALTYFEGGDLQTLSVADRQFLTAQAGEVQHIPTIALAAPSLAP